MEKAELVQVILDDLKKIVDKVKEYDPKVDHIHLAWLEEDNFFDIVTTTGDKDKKLSHQVNLDKEG